MIRSLITKLGALLLGALLGLLLATVLTGCTQAQREKFASDHPRVVAALDKGADVAVRAAHDPLVNSAASGIPGGSIAVGLVSAAAGWWLKNGHNALKGKDEGEDEPAETKP